MNVENGKFAFGWTRDRSIVVVESESSTKSFACHTMNDDVTNQEGGWHNGRGRDGLVNKIWARKQLSIVLHSWSQIRWNGSLTRAVVTRENILTPGIISLGKSQPMWRWQIFECKMRKVSTSANRVLRVTWLWWQITTTTVLFLLSLLRIASHSPSKSSFCYCKSPPGREPVWSRPVLPRLRWSVRLLLPHAKYFSMMNRSTGCWSCHVASLARWCSSSSSFACQEAFKSDFILLSLIRNPVRNKIISQTSKKIFGKLGQLLFCG